MRCGTNQSEMNAEQQTAKSRERCLLQQLAAKLLLLMMIVCRCFSSLIWREKGGEFCRRGNGAG